MTLQLSQIIRTSEATADDNIFNGKENQFNILRCPVSRNYQANVDASHGETSNRRAVTCLALSCANVSVRSALATVKGTDRLTDYTAYADWKSWAPVDFMRPTKTERSYYAREFRRCDLKGKNVLEIGFGNGSFLGWAKEQGARVYGTEIQPELKKRAEAAYVAVESSALSELLPHRTKFFHVIVALDVFEHISIEQLPGLLMVISELLADDGLLVARYPNGQSPFGRTYQYGDITHVTVLSAGIMMQLVENLPFAIVHLGNPARPSGAIHVIRALLQRAIEIALHGIYLFRGPIAPNSVAVLRRLPRRVS